MSFEPPVTQVYNPLAYAWDAYCQYVRMATASGTRVMFLGMNPGPWGMTQSGVPFGEIAAVRDWLKIDAPVGRPAHEHPKRPVLGLQCQRSEVSGRRLWGLFQQRFGEPRDFFGEHFVANYCPLVFMEQSARNRTPDKLSAAERSQLDEACDQHLQALISTLSPSFLVGIGVYAEKCLRRNVEVLGADATIVRILHPSPASPAANRDWAGTATDQLIAAGVWQ